MRHECETANVMSALCGLWLDKCRDVINMNAYVPQGNKEDKMNNCRRLTLKIQKNSFPWSLKIQRLKARNTESIHETRLLYAQSMHDLPQSPEHCSPTNQGT